MKAEEFERVIDNEKEWRRHILKTQLKQSEDIEKVNRKVSNVELKVVGFGSFFGFIAAYIKTKMGS